MSAARLVALLSDFGERDGYAGALRGAVLAACPDARLVDLSHEIPPGDIARGARVLAQAAVPFPAGSVFCAVVDPGVGTARRALAVSIDGRLHVAPDNGLLGGVLDGAREVRAHALENPVLWRTPPSPVFHGRDVFGPVAGYLAGGGELAAVGPAVEPGELVRLDAPLPRRVGDGWQGEVVAVDRFGNLITNLHVAAGQRARVEIAGRALPLGRTYADVEPGALLALVGSGGCLEIACNRGRVADVLGEGACEGLLVTWAASAGDPA